ncbi:tyrosine-protein phosphatase, partial [Vibrio sp.]|uniref:tyrosine-protein phosphatase n=1 Tax=Vibrio sp. TaxID=678 RepID=UPI003D0A2812
MIDYHCHILPGLDDGCRDVTEAVDMARQLLEAGFTRIYCTPHCITGLYEIAPAQVKDAVAELRAVFKAEGIPIELDCGMEYYVDDFLADRLDCPMPLGNTRLLLFELPTKAAVENLYTAVTQIKNSGLLPLLAHPERFFAANMRLKDRVWLRLCGVKQNSSHEVSDVKILPQAILKAVNMGCFLQADIGSFVGIYGKRTQMFAQLLLDCGLYTHFGSDGHNSLQLKKILTWGKIHF